MAGARERTFSRQMVLDLTGAPGFASEDFLVSPCNRAAYDLIGLWPDWPFQTLVMIGPPGSGKSHLGAIWANKAGAHTIGSSDLVEPDRAILYRAVLLEDCDRRSGPEHDLFHFLNATKEAQIPVVMTARREPDRWGVKTADLLSRLRQSPLTKLDEADEALLRAVLIKLFDDRQMRVEEEIVEFLLMNLERSFEAVARCVKIVDEASLSAGRRITKPLVASVLSTMAGPESDQGPM